MSTSIDPQIVIWQRYGIKGADQGSCEGEIPCTFIAFLTRNEQIPITIQMVNVTDELMLVSQLNAVSAPLPSDMNARNWKDP